MKYISYDNLFKFLDGLRRDYNIYVPFKKDSQRYYGPYNGPSDNIVIGEVRPFEPLKGFLISARAKVAENFKPAVPHSHDKPLCIAGVKACDLKGFKVQDFVFRDHDYADPFYNKMRDENLIISADCTTALDTCFCTALGVMPYPTESFDINLAQSGNGFIVEHGSKKGSDIITKYPFVFRDASKDAVNEVQSQRKAVLEILKKNIKENAVPLQELFKGIVEKGYTSDIWSDEAKACVECGSCNTICPTCHCFLLYDQKRDEKLARYRIWDSCMIKDFARVAAGANPRPKLWMRLRNRFEKKFDFFPKVAGVYACTGCGRCILSCPAKIDIRKVLKRLVKNASSS